MSAVRTALRNESSFSTRQSRNLFRSVLLLLLLTLLCAAGCKKKEPGRLTSARIHDISQELAGAVRQAAPAGTRIDTGQPTSNKNPIAMDHLDITLPPSIPESAVRADITKIQQALGAVATRQGLTEEISESREGVLIYYLKSGIRTHAVHIHAGARAAEQTGNVPQGGARLAIILDDLGSDRAAAEAIFALPYPLTISVLPNHEHSGEIANEAQHRGYQVMLHLPMQAVASEKPEARELRPDMPKAEVSQLVDQFLQSVPGAVGVNNHQGSRATSDSTLMGELMPVLRDHHLFYIDSRTTAATVAYDTAQNSGVPSAFRNVPFLDDVTEVSAVRKQLGLALRDAREKGQAIAIGHPHAGTLQALREMLPNAQSQGVRLVFASELVH